MARSADESFLTEGFTLGGRFKLERLLGRGAAGSVWLATHLALSSPVAIKFLDQIAKHLHEDEELEGYVDRFRFEAQVSARLSARTRHTVAVHDAGVFRGVPFLVMEFAPGQSLEEVIAAVGTLDSDELIKMAEDIGEALGAAHEIGIIHRDVKTPNILRVERDGQKMQYKLADFGVARMSGVQKLDLAAPKKTGDGMIVGTPAYMSPEQIAADETCGPATDLWALGVVLYEAMTGRMPFVGVSLTELAMHISATPHEAPSAKHNYGPAVDAFFSRALAKRPIDRFDTGPDMARAFRAALEAPLKPTKVIQPDRAKRRATLVVVGVCLLGACIGTGAWLMHTPPALSTEAPTATRLDDQHSDFAGTDRPEISPGVISVTSLPGASLPTTTGARSSGGRRDSHPPAAGATFTATPTAAPSETAAPVAPPPAPIPTPNINRPPVNKSEIQ